MNKFSILHISDLHRKPESFDNESLIFAIKKDIELLKENGISPPEFCIVTGDLIQGSLEDGEKSFIEIRKQYQITADLLTKIAEIILNKETKNVIILPGNHDRCLSLAKEAFSGLQLPDDDVEKNSFFMNLKILQHLKDFVQFNYLILLRIFQNIKIALIYFLNFIIIFIMETKYLILIEINNSLFIVLKNEVW